jgi:hypothetical protein
MTRQNNIKKKCFHILAWLVNLLWIWTKQITELLAGWIMMGKGARGQGQAK